MALKQQWKYLVISDDGQDVYGTDDDELAEYYFDHCDYSYVRSSDVDELEDIRADEDSD